MSLHLDVERRVLVITGPNTGGKTVALKAVGLLTAMHHAGLPIPSGFGSAVPPTGNVWADIGDDQSIAQSLSTFSGHLTSIQRILLGAVSGDVVLLDEAGAGTDPAEGLRSQPPSSTSSDFAVAVCWPPATTRNSSSTRMSHQVWPTALWHSISQLLRQPIASKLVRQGDPRHLRSRRVSVCRRRS